MILKPVVEFVAYAAVASLVIGAVACLIGITREAWAFKETAAGILFISLAVLIHGFFITGASTFGPVPVLKAEVMNFGGEFPGPYSIVDLSTERGYLLNAPLPQPANFDTFYRDNRQVTIKFSLWNNKIHWMRTDNTTPPTTIGHSPRFSYAALAELFGGFGLISLAWVVWLRAVQKGFTREKDPFVLLRQSK